MKIIENAKLAAEVERKLPWLIDIFLYPTSISGIIHIIIFLVAPFAISLIDRFILGWVWPVGDIIALLLYGLCVGYVFFYLGYCIFDSSKGGLRAPDITMEPIPDKGELVWQLFFILGCIAVCFWPAAVYYIFTQRTDLWFVLLLAGGIFFFPMSLLAVVLFDSIDSLNPIMIIRSIFRTFFSYCSLVLWFCGLSLSVFMTRTALPQSRLLILTFYGLVVYWLMIIAHLLGRFYWLHKDKLNWGL